MKTIRVQIAVTLLAVAALAGDAYGVIVANNVNFNTQTRPNGVALSDQSLITGATEFRMGFFSSFSDTDINNAIAVGNIISGAGNLASDFVGVTLSDIGPSAGAGFTTYGATVLTDGQDSASTAVGDAANYDVFAGQDVFVWVLDGGSNEFGLARMNTTFFAAQPDPTNTSSTAVTLLDPNLAPLVGTIFSGSFESVILNSPVDQLGGGAGLGPDGQNSVFTLAQVVPEPSIGIFAMVGGLGMLLRRQRRVACA